MVFGIVLVLMARKFRIPRILPFASMNPLNWIPLWKMRGFFRGPGYWLTFAGICLICFGALLLLARYLFTP
jgi:hypothetical protein